MALQAAICTQCGAQIQVDETKEAGICPSCGTAFITEKVIHNFVTNNSFAGATINIQGGVDIENLYILARRAVDANNKDDVLKYYGQIKERNPNDWESTFFYAWFENGESFYKYFNVTADLILQMESETQIEALNRIKDFFNKINLKFPSYGQSSPFPLKSTDEYCNFIMKFFDARNIEVINSAQYLLNFMGMGWGISKVYLEILSRQDKFYVPFLQNYHMVLHLAPGASYNVKECSKTINEVEADIGRLNLLLDSDEDKKKNYFAYYKWLIEDCADRLMPSNLKYVESKIKELDSNYFVSKESRKAATQNMRNAKAKQRQKRIKIETNILFVLLSVTGIFGFYYTGHSVWGTLSLILLIILNISMLSSDKTSTRVVLKFVIFVVLAGIAAYLFDNEFYIYF